MSKKKITLTDIIANLKSLETSELKELITRATALLSDEDLLLLRPRSEPVRTNAPSWPEHFKGSSIVDPEEAFKKPSPKPGTIIITPVKITDKTK